MKNVNCVALGVLMIAAAGAVGEEPAPSNAFANFVEFRVYTIMEGKRDDFLEHFEARFLETQEAEQMWIWGQFYDLETPTRFVWVRGYRSMEERVQGLKDFYFGPAWREFGPTAKSMLEAPQTNIRFVEPVAGGAFKDMDRPIEPVESPGVVVAQVFDAGESDLDAFASELAKELGPIVTGAEGEIMGTFASSDEENNFPFLPYIEGERAVVIFMSYPSREAFEGVRGDCPDAIETYLLGPGPRSRMRHGAS